MVSHAEGVHILEARAYSVCRAGLITEGRGLLGALEDRLAEMDASLVYVPEMQGRARQLRSTLKEGRDVTQALLGSWRQHTIDSLALAE